MPLPKRTTGASHDRAKVSSRVSPGSSGVVSFWQRAAPRVAPGDEPPAAAEYSGEDALFLAFFFFLVFLVLLGEDDEDDDSDIWNIMLLDNDGMPKK